MAARWGEGLGTDRHRACDVAVASLGCRLDRAMRSAILLRLTIAVLLGMSVGALTHACIGRTSEEIGHAQFSRRISGNANGGNGGTRAGSEQGAHPLLRLHAGQ